MSSCESATICLNMVALYLMQEMQNLSHAIITLGAGPYERINLATYVLFTPTFRGASLDSSCELTGAAT